VVKTFVSVDGFNLYYGGLKDTPNKWLDLEGLVRKFLKPECDVLKIKFFTAMVSARPSDPGQPQRQQIYLRAIKANPKVEVILGHFQSHAVSMQKADGTGKCKVIKTEEKGSDVNIATHMIVDAFGNRFDLAVLVSNDSDLMEPVKQVRAAFGKRVGVLNPHCRTNSRPSVVLRANATFFNQIRPGHLAGSQLPPQVLDSKGVVTKPVEWNQA
jgi:uncharacterized LabA/DUF88 family protein